MSFINNSTFKFFYSNWQYFNNVLVLKHVTCLVFHVKLWRKLVLTYSHQLQSAPHQHLFFLYSSDLFHLFIKIIRLIPGLKSCKHVAFVIDLTAVVPFNAFSISHCVWWVIIFRTHRFQFNIALNLALMKKPSLLHCSCMCNIFSYLLFWFLQVQSLAWLRLESVQSQELFLIIGLALF